MKGSAYNFFDQYSLLHLASGIIAFFWGMSLPFWIALHIAFELFENSDWGMDFVNRFSKWWFWPGDKNYPDGFVNSMLGDNFFAIIGWFVGFYADYLGKKYNWYNENAL